MEGADFYSIIKISLQEDCNQADSKGMSKFQQYTQSVTSPSLPSHGSTVLIFVKVPPPTGAVDPRPTESSLKRKSPKYI